MNGAESLVRTLIASGVEVCFANPGTSEIHFVAALDKVSGLRAILCLFEGVVTGAADGYGRMAEKPACTLLHLGPGLANGLANLHNARRAETPIVNIIGDHATYHSQYDAPLVSDVAGFCSASFGLDSRLAQRSDRGCRCRACGSGVEGTPGSSCDSHFASRYGMVGSRPAGASACSASDCCARGKGCAPSG